MISGCFLLFSSFLLKWGKSLMVLSLMEAASILILILILASPAGSVSSVLLIFPFLVSEALILFTALYSALRISGSSMSGSIFF